MPSYLFSEICKQFLLSDDVLEIETGTNPNYVIFSAAGKKLPRRSIKSDEKGSTIITVK